ncbi:MAG TPA: rod shape-determining protein MreC [Nitrospiria bacterium]
MLRPTKNHPGLIGVLIILSMLMLFLFPELQSDPLRFITRPIAQLVFQIQRGFSSVGEGISGVWDGYIRLRSVRDENIQLRKTMAQLQNENIRLLEADQTNRRLTQLLALKSSVPYSLTAARVIGRDSSNWYHSLTIDKGMKDGITSDMGVISPSGVVGRVSKVGPNFSQVLLLTDRNSAVAALIQTSRDEGLIEGTENGLAKIKYVSLLSSAQKGDLVLTSGLTGTFPKGILIGTIGTLAKSDTELFQQAEVVPSADFSRLEEVQVITLFGGPEHKK